jgi:RES domain-containing protein
LNGEGSRLYGGRHTPAGIPAVYCSENIALAILEVLVHLDKSEIPRDYVLIAVAIKKPEGEYPDLPSRRAALAPGEFRKRFYNSPVWKAPSAVVPRERNFILLPEAPKFEARVDWVEPLRFDQRLFPVGQEK